MRLSTSAADRRRLCIAALCMLGFGVSGTLHAALIETFFGNDNPGVVRPLNIPNALAEKGAFLAGLTISLQDDFESYSDTSNLLVTNGGNVRVAGASVFVPVPISGAQRLGWAAGPAIDTFEWSVPAGNAFGFFGVDIGDGANENLALRLLHADGGTTSVDVPHSLGFIASDAVFFLGVVADKPFTRVEFVNDGTPFDFSPPVLVFDDFVAGTRAITPIPEPAVWLTMICGLVLIVGARQVRGRMSVPIRTGRNRAMGHVRSV